jgi:hypothetical protein
MRIKTQNKDLNVGGRPRKFSEPSRPITVTLPDRVLGLLADIDSDRAKAITKSTESVAGSREKHDRVKIVNIDNDTAIIIVGHNNCLSKIPWLKLVEIAPCKYIIAVPTGTEFEKLEIAILDLLESARKDSPDWTLLTELRTVLNHFRRTNKMSKHEILLLAHQKGKGI